MPGTHAPLSDDAIPSHIEQTKASIARVYDAALGGKENYEIDRQVVAQLRQVVPEINQYAWSERNFLIRATRFLAGHAGITQFLDCGSGLPTAENTHQVAQRHNPDAVVVYVDNDPSVITHGRALLAENDQTFFSAADIFEPRQVLNDKVVRRHLDFSEPIALYQIGTFQHYDGKRRSPQSVMAEYIDALASGSYVAIVHFFDPETPTELHNLARRLEQTFQKSPMASGWFRTRTEIEAMLAGLELIEPGLVPCVDWWPDGPPLTPLDPALRCLIGVVARKP
jgi:SAM-dependent methyltransferase